MEKRPTFLTVLCILTFVYSAYFVVTSLFSSALINTSSEMMKESKSKIDSLIETANYDSNAETKASKKMLNFASKMTDGFEPEKIKKNLWAQLFAQLLCLGGALLMWKTKKIGFYGYLAGTIVGIIAPLVIFGTGNFIGLMTTASAAFIGVIFCILYGLNFKHLK